MHLDTVFTIVSNNEALVYPPFLNDNNEIHILKMKEKIMFQMLISLKP